MEVNLSNFIKIFPMQDCAVKEAEIIESYGVETFQTCLSNRVNFMLGNNFFAEEIDEYMAAFQAICIDGNFIAVDFPVLSLECHGTTKLFAQGAANIILLSGNDFSYNLESKHLHIHE